MANDTEIKVLASAVEGHWWGLFQWFLEVVWAGTGALFVYGWHRHEKEIKNFEVQKKRVGQLNTDLDKMHERMNEKFDALDVKVAEIHEGHAKCRAQCDQMQSENKRVQERIFDSIDKLRLELGSMNLLLGRALGLVEANKK